MRHAAPHTAPRRPLARGAQVTLGALVYALAAAGTTLTALGATLVVWGLWQWLGVN